MRDWQSRLARFAPYLLLGPISGPLIYKVRVNIREDRPFLAALYTLVLVQYLILLLLVGQHVRLVETQALG